MKPPALIIGKPTTISVENLARPLTARRIYYKQVLRGKKELLYLNTRKF